MKTGSWCGVVTAMALTVSVSAVTVEERVQKLRELEQVNLQNKIDEAKAKGAAATVKPAAPTDNRTTSNLNVPLPGAGPLPGMVSTPLPTSLPKDDFELLGVFGVGKTLEAEIRYQGIILTVPVGGDILEGWKLDSLAARWADIGRPLPPKAVKPVKVAKPKPGKPVAVAKAEPTRETFRIYISSTGVKEVATAQAQLPAGLPMTMPVRNTAPLPVQPMGQQAPLPMAPGALLPQGIRTNTN